MILHRRQSRSTSFQQQGSVASFGKLHSRCHSQRAWKEPSDSKVVPDKTTIQEHERRDFRECKAASVSVPWKSTTLLTLESKRFHESQHVDRQKAASSQWHLHYSGSSPSLLLLCCSTNLRTTELLRSQRRLRSKASYCNRPNVFIQSSKPQLLDRRGMGRGSHRVWRTASIF